MDDGMRGERVNLCDVVHMLKRRRIIRTGVAA